MTLPNVQSLSLHGILLPPPHHQHLYSLITLQQLSYHPPHHQHLYSLINLQQSQLQDHLFPLPLVSHTLEPPIPDEVQPTENAELDYLKGLDFSVST